MMVSGRHLFNRRTFLNDMRHGLSGIALAQLLGNAGLLAADKTSLRPAINLASPNAPREPHFSAKAIGREPDERELQDATAITSEHGLTALTRALLNANEFLFIP